MFNELKLFLPIRLTLPITMKISKITAINLALIIGLILMNRYNFLLFHSFIEGVCIVISIGIFMVTVNSAEKNRYGFFSIIGYCYLFVGITDFIHMLGYKGMNIFNGFDISFSTQLWIVGRYIESLSFLIASISFYRKINIKYITSIISAIFITSLISIFYFHNFPITFIEGRGVTAVKSYSEYLICLLLGISMILITKRKDKFETKVYQNLMSFAMLAMIGEFVFSSYRDLYSLENVIGHYFKLLSYYFLYNAVFVTGIKTPYQLLAKSREKYQTLTRFAPVGIFNLDEAGNMIYTNLRLSEISGLIREQINSVSWLEATYPIDKTTVNNQWKNTITSGMQFNMEYRIQSSSGKITWVQCLIDALKDEENNVVGFIGTVTDITERKLAVELMLKGEKLYKITFENAPIGIAHTSISGRFLRVNDRFCQIIGYTKEEIFKITRQSLIHPEEMDQDQTEITRLICGEVKSIGAEQRYIRKDKRVIYASLKISLFSKYNDSAEYLIVVFDDITKRKETERLVHKSLKEKRLLLGEIHHRVKNNLSIVDGLLKMQSLKVKDEYFKGLIFECQSRIASIALIHEKLYQSESIAEINFKLYIDSLIIKLRNTYSDDIERIKFNNMADEIYFDIDTATPLGLIINEILTNAVKHAFPDRSSGVIDIFLYQIKDDYGSQYYELIIKDNGAGFPDELDLYKSETLGLRLINGLASTQLNGQILFENKRRESKTISGAEIKIKFKKFTRVQGE